MIYKTRAAWSAFRDPDLVGEALGLRRTLLELHPGSREFCLLYAEISGGGRVWPMVRMIPYRDRERIRGMLSS